MYSLPSHVSFSFFSTFYFIFHIPSVCCPQWIQMHVDTKLHIKLDLRAERQLDSVTISYFWKKHCAYHRMLASTYSVHSLRTESESRCFMFVMSLWKRNISRTDKFYVLPLTVKCLELFFFFIYSWLVFNYISGRWISRVNSCDCCTNKTRIRVSSKQWEPYILTNVAHHSIGDWIFLLEYNCQHVLRLRNKLMTTL